ncbi:MAG: hypothetical protein GXO89_15330 [Chlorobi bacterium]|nr:hypothetical protein [Chlorobiota bacterium]
MKTKHFLFAIMLAAIPFLFLTQSCDKAKDATKFDVSMDLPDHYFVLDSNIVKSSASIKEETMLTQQAISINIDSVFSANGLSSASLSNAGFTHITVLMDNPLPGANFDFMSGMRVVLSETADSEETQIAVAENIPAGSTEVTFTLDNSAIQSFIDNHNFYLRLYGQMGPLPWPMLPLILQSGIEFTVNPL